MGREEHCKQTLHVWGLLAMYGPHWVCPSSRRRALSRSGPICSSGELSKVGPAFCTLPRSNLLRFRFLGTPQRHRFSWVCVLCPSWVSSSGNHLLGERTVPGGLCFLITSLVPAAWFAGCAMRAPSQVCCVSPLGS